MNLFEIIVEASLKSSKTVNDVVTGMTKLVEEIKTIKATLINLSNVMQIQQYAIDELYQINDATPVKTLDVKFLETKNDKKAKPN
jgi:hypothetical protein